jgi:hypothetical protein
MNTRISPGMSEAVKMVSRKKERTRRTCVMQDTQAPVQCNKPDESQLSIPDSRLIGR